MSRKKDAIATALDEESDSSFRTLPTDEEQTNYSLEEDRTFRRHRSYIDKENKTKSQKASPRKMVKPPLPKTKPLQAATKSNENSYLNRGHSRVFHDDSDSSSNLSQNVRQPGTSLPTRTPKPSENASNQNANRNRHRRKLKKPEKKGGALNEIRKMQNSHANLIPMLPFGRLVQEIMLHRSRPESMRITPLALQALRDSSEAYIVSLFEDVNRITLNRNQVTIQLKDMELAMFIRGHS